MKGFLSALAVMVAIVGALAGCSASAAYSAEERQVIDTANQLVRDECDATFDADDFSYSVGKQIDETEFVPLDSREQQDDAYKDIVSVSALKTTAPDEGDVYEFSVTFNARTKEVLSISANIAK